MIRFAISICAFVLSALPVYAGVADEAFATSQMSLVMKADIKALGSAAVYSLPIPVEGVVISDLRDTWGDARSSGRTHEGIDIFADRGTVVISPTDAVVGSIGYGAIGGNFIFTINPGGERYYFAHLNSVAGGMARGDVISKGDVIGYVGNTGNANHAKPHLHFTIYGPEAMNPYPRLNSVYSSDTTKAAVVAGSGGYSGNLPNSDLEDGDEGSSVRTLQLFLINNSEGVARNRLASVGPTGYFGGITKNALIEYQKDNKIYPASGYFGSLTRAYMNESSILSAFTRDLEKGMKGDDVLALQKYLNREGYTVSQSGDGSRGNETIFFGNATRLALIAFQKNHGISPALGYFGPLTRTHVFK